MFGVKMDIDDEGRMLSENDTNSEVLTMSEDTTQTSNEDQGIDVEEYENLLQRPLTDAEKDFLQEIQDKRDAEKKEMSEPKIIKELNANARQREDSDRRAVSSLTGLAGGQTRNGRK
jgi:hypothetical protein